MSSTLCGKPRTGALVKPPVKEVALEGRGGNPWLLSPAENSVLLSRTSQPELLGNRVWALSFLCLCWKRGEESPSKNIPQVTSLWAVAKLL